MKAVFDIGRVLGNAQFGWADILKTSGQRHCDSKYLSGTIHDIPEYYQMETGELSLDGYLQFLQREFCLDSIESAIKVHQSILLDEFPGVQSVVEDLHAAGFETAALSNNNPIHWQMFTASGRYPSVELIQHKFSSFELGLMKPDPKIYDAFCERIGWSPSEIIFVDDTAKNVEVASERGWNAFKVDPFQPMEPQLREIFSLKSQ